MTAGFENHTGKNALASIKGFRKDIMTQVEETYEVATLVIRESIAQPDMLQVQMHSQGNPLGAVTIGGYLSKREAIYLRNRLTAFIEEGLDSQPE